MSKSLDGKKIILAVTGGIAAYKAALLSRLLIKEGADVKVMMTASAQTFISPLTFSVLTQNPCITEFTSDDNWNSHVELGVEADLMLFAPLTANTLAKMSTGICDNVIMATYLSARCPVFIAPAMDMDMWQHPTTSQNVRTVESHGVHVIPVGKGELASGLEGPGRMAEPIDILKAIQGFFLTKNDLTGKHVLISAGPTQEAIDPVRYITNHSTGTMGVALAREAINRGATVKLVLGESGYPHNLNGIDVLSVRSAGNMFEACVAELDKADICIMAAAVADYKPANVSDKKIKKSEGTMTIDLAPTQDIAKYLGEHKSSNQLLIGFAMETDNAEANASKKLKKKNLDFIVLNELGKSGIGFGTGTNKVTILFPNNEKREFALKSKAAVATDVLDIAVEKMNEKN